ncbi:phage integrase family protein [Clostridium saccharobutylicum]|uniref:tyrosine-type recombinase/integrase n=1 Tax=Clostridium saccharobutylicum TaxID=169679 RepID=UPI000983BDB0|nr:site-specific integrase [Clostridium saccharobutylicum]AQS09911.1 phage integrase family protein [Clostridium saccharobutylicum]AQS11162.1 phage integrase family protein [Clostridium saccharobutylicum]MBC2438835.1 site-specific integrase [Clostridium saccharobutylicum]NSB91113.1 integrase [Clostridium saccharobutylicum]NYC27680.1 integrase [Clostridium saccharobutylicum]
MAITKLNLQPITTESDYSNITIGNSKFTDDIWDLSSFITSKTIRNTYKKINFSYIKNEDMKFTIKLYSYYKLGKVKPQTLHHDIKNKLPSFIKYCKLNNISNFNEITKKIFLDFTIWLKERKVARITGYQNCHIIEQIIKIGQVKGWNVVKNNIFVDINSMDLWKPQKVFKENRTKPIPEDIFDKILQCALKEKNILTKAGILIQSQTGLRINEVLSIRQGCVYTTSDGYNYMEVTLSKTEKGDPIIHKVFINELVKNIVTELEKYTKELRKESGLKELFLVRHNAIKVVNSDIWTGKRLPDFIKKWDIRDDKGNLYPLKSHQFRATFVRELIKQKVPIAYIMKQFAHVSIEMTSHYLTLQDEEIKEIYSDMILGKDSKIAGLRAKEIKSKLDEQFRGKTEQEIDDIVSNLSKSMSFNPLPTGVCLYDFRRGNCSDGDGCFFYNCPNYVTEVKFYPILKQELDLMEKEMSRYKELGQQRSWERQYVKYKYLKPLVDSLEVQINGKES